MTQQNRPEMPVTEENTVGGYKPAQDDKNSRTSSADATNGIHQPEYGKNGLPIFKRAFVPGVKSNWREVMDGVRRLADGGFIAVRPRVNYGGDNEYPDTFPYNDSDKGRYCFNGPLTGSSANDAVIWGGG